MWAAEDRSNSSSSMDSGWPRTGEQELLQPQTQLHRHSCCSWPCVLCSSNKKLIYGPAGWMQLYKVEEGEANWGLTRVRRLERWWDQAVAHLPSLGRGTVELHFGV